MLCGVSIVGLDESAKLLLAADRSVASRLEGSIQYFVFHVQAPVRPLRIVVADPGARNVIELVPAEAHEVIEAFAFHCADEGLGEGIRLGCLDGTANSIGAVRAPEFPKSLGILRVPVVGYDSRFTEFSKGRKSPKKPRNLTVSHRSYVFEPPDLLGDCERRY